MARRRGKPGDYLITDDYYGTTVFQSQVTTDYWGNIAVKPLQRNLQEISSPLGDPYPVSQFRGPQYEATTACSFETQPVFIGKTTKRFPQTQITSFFGLDPGIGDASIGCTFVVH